MDPGLRRDDVVGVAADRRCIQIDPGQRRYDTASVPTRGTTVRYPHAVAASSSEAAAKLSGTPNRSYSSESVIRTLTLSPGLMPSAS